jgi:ketosteroid isomerase-like protein
MTGHRIFRTRRILLTHARFASLVAAGWFTLAAQGPAASGRTSDSTFRQLISARLAAYDRGDSSAYRKLLADDFVHVDDRGVRRSTAQVIARVAGNSGTQNRHEVGELHFRQFGDIAVVDAEVVEYSRLGPREMSARMYETDVFVRQGKRWLFLQHAETPTVALPIPIEPDLALLDQYVGRYERWPGYAEKISRKGNALYVEVPGESPTQLHPATRESFFVAGEPSLIVFVRDPKGRVTDFLVHFPDGQVSRARKVE